LSVVASSQRRLVWPVAVALTAAMVYALFLYLPTRTSSTTSVPRTLAPPGVAQADWEVRTFPAGGAGVGHMGAKAKAQVKAQREPLALLVRDVYDAMFLEPGRAKQVVRARFEAAAGSTALAKKIGLPPGLEEVQIKKRSARIGISVVGAKTAAASVKVSGTVMKDGHRTAFKHRSTLWLDKTKSTWKIIGFDVSQGPRT